MTDSDASPTAFEIVREFLHDAWRAGNRHNEDYNLTKTARLLLESLRVSGESMHISEQASDTTPWDGTLPRPRQTEYDFPSRSDIRWWSQAEHAIQYAVDITESMGASEALTRAVGLLSDARAWVADHVEGVPADEHYPRPAASASASATTDKPKDGRR